jgi:hypothetical protein
MVVQTCSVSQAAMLIARARLPPIQNVSDHACGI